MHFLHLMFLQNVISRTHFSNPQKFELFSLMIDFKKAKERKASTKLLQTLCLENVNFGDIIDLKVHTLSAEEKDPEGADWHYFT